MLYTKCMFDPVEKKDGWRISVMSRHTLNDGKTRDERITPEKYHAWIPELAPKEVGKYKRGEITFSELMCDYVSIHLAKPEIEKVVKDLARMAVEEDVTILCSENLKKDPHCHRVFLAEMCRKYEKDLRVEHR